MGLGRIAETIASLVAAGREWTTPVAVVASATRHEQKIVRGTHAGLSGIADWDLMIRLTEGKPALALS